MTDTITHHPAEGRFARSEKFDTTVMVELVEDENCVWVSFDDGGEDETTLEDLTILPE